jgi:hypothetical protein
MWLDLTDILLKTSRADLERSKGSKRQLAAGEAMER